MKGIADFVLEQGVKLTKKTQINIYRILQEALTNLAKHSQANRVLVAIKKQHDKVLLIVEDDGKGFDVERLTIRDQTEKGFGLISMDARRVSRRQESRGKGDRDNPIYSAYHDYLPSRASSLMGRCPAIYIH